MTVRAAFPPAPALPGVRVAAALLLSLLIGIAPALAQHAPISTEQGQTPLDESFDRKERRKRIRETRRQALRDTTWDVQLRSYALDRNRFDDTESAAWALGGSVGFKTGHFRERYALGATGYTSQRLYGPEDKDGTLLLQPGQHGYSVLGEFYGQALLGEGVALTIGRKAYDTPYINRKDIRMTPNTFEAYTVQGVIGGTDGRSEWRFGGGYFDEIKEINSDEFVSMASAAGAPTGVERGVWAGGGNFKSGDFSLGAVDYFSDDIINIFYTEARYAIGLRGRSRLQFAAQYTDQRSVGDDLLDGSRFSADQYGLKGELVVGDGLLTAAYTSTGAGTSMRSPWSGYPGFTSVQVEDFNRAGEDAWMLRAAYNFPTVRGLSVYGLWVSGSAPDDPAQYARDEYDLNLQWTAGSGAWQGLMLRLRYAHIAQHSPVEANLDDFRLLIFYDPPSL